MTVVVSPQLLQALTDLTGKIDLDSSCAWLPKTPLSRLESIAKQLLALEQKYGMSFEQFDERFQARRIAKPIRL